MTVFLYRLSPLSSWPVLVHILSPKTDNCYSWIRGRERMTVENIWWLISMQECCRNWRGSYPRPLIISRIRIRLPSRPAPEFRTNSICLGSKCKNSTGSIRPNILSSSYQCCSPSSMAIWTTLGRVSFFIYFFAHTQTRIRASTVMFHIICKARVLSQWYIIFALCIWFAMIFYYTTKYWNITKSNQRWWPCLADHCFFDILREDELRSAFYSKYKNYLWLTIYFKNYLFCSFFCFCHLFWYKLHYKC